MGLRLRVFHDYVKMESEQDAKCWPGAFLLKELCSVGLVEMILRHQFPLISDRMELQLVRKECHDRCTN